MASPELHLNLNGFKTITFSIEIDASQNAEKVFEEIEIELNLDLVEPEKLKNNKAA